MTSVASPHRRSRQLGVEDLGSRPARRITQGVGSFEEISLVQAPPQDSPYFYAGILNFVFGHLWQRPGLTRRERRLITIPCAGVSDAIGPIQSHVTSALGSSDVSYDEMQELIVHFSAYAGRPRARCSRTSPPSGRLRTHDLRRRRHEVRQRASDRRLRRNGCSRSTGSTASRCGRSRSKPAPPTTRPSTTTSVPREGSSVRSSGTASRSSAASGGSSQRGAIPTTCARDSRRATSRCSTSPKRPTTATSRSSNNCSAGRWRPSRSRRTCRTFPKKGSAPTTSSAATSRRCSRTSRSRCGGFASRTASCSVSTRPSIRERAVASGAELPAFELFVSSLFDGLMAFLSAPASEAARGGGSFGRMTLPINASACGRSVRVDRHARATRAKPGRCRCRRLRCSRRRRARSAARRRLRRRSTASGRRRCGASAASGVRSRGSCSPSRRRARGKARISPSA